jgi:hypothetical protein
MKDLKKNIMEHLKTRKKYNTLMLKYEVAKEDLEKKQIELNTQKRINLKEKEIWENKLKEQEEEIIILKRKIKKLKMKNEKERVNKE